MLSANIHLAVTAKDMRTQASSSRQASQHYYSLLQGGNYCHALTNAYNCEKDKFSKLLIHSTRSTTTVEISAWLTRERYDLEASRSGD